MSQETPPEYGPPASLPPGLDWLSYKAAYFPGRRPRDLEAIVAYSAYRRYHATGPDESDGVSDGLVSVGKAAAG